MLKYIALGQDEDNGSSASSASDESTGSRRSSFSHQEELFGADMSPDLQSCFEFNLRAISHPKIKSTFEHNLPVVLQDPGLPTFIKALLVEKMSAMERILGKMALQSPSQLLMRSDQKGSHFDHYAEVSTRLKAALIMHKDPAGVTFSGRSLKLFSWCQAELTETAHPLVGFLMDALTTSESKSAVEERFKRLADISNLLILQIACGDDISDNIQDEVLVPCFVNIPLSDEIRASKGLPSRADSLAFVAHHRDGIFSAYYETAVAIWDDAIVQLRDLFGREWTPIESGFLTLHEKVMQSLTYSIFMNIRPHDETITDESILENLAPNMMVECFRFLEKSLVMQIADERGLSLPGASDIAICDAIVYQSQKSASLANSTATAAREMRENDISNAIPFSLNESYMGSLKEDGLELGDVFEKFLKKNGYRNHFFAQYEYDDDTAPTGFDCLDLQILRKLAMRRVMETLGALESRGLTIDSENYFLAALAQKTLVQISESKNELHYRDAKTLKKLTTHIQLIDLFFDNRLAETKVEETLFQKWAKDISGMRESVAGIESETLSGHAQTYVTSWEDFLCMYLLFKRAYDGTI
jgi:hypothetical protein